MVVTSVGAHTLLLHASPTGQELPQVPQFCASYNRSRQPSEQLVSPEVHRVRQIPCWQICEELQGIPHAPQLLLSVIISVQLALHARRSDGQTTAFVGIGEVTGDPVTVVTTVIIPMDRVVSGRRVSTITYDVTTGVIRGVPIGDKKGKILTIPAACRR